MIEFPEWKRERILFKHNTRWQHLKKEKYQLLTEDNKLAADFFLGGGGNHFKKLKKCQNE
jgi:hypothetical protein